jgi:ABC-type hemin transport system substrate-binding protein
MTMRDDTYGSSLLARLGWENVLVGGPDRYPELTLDQLAAHHPELVLLPSEPYPFADRHVAAVAERCPGAKVILVDGQDLFWWGIRTPAAVGRLRRALTEPQ